MGKKNRFGPEANCHTDKEIESCHPFPSTHKKKHINPPVLAVSTKIQNGGIVNLTSIPARDGVAEANIFEAMLRQCQDNRNETDMPMISVRTSERGWSVWVIASRAQSTK